jgi:hypothetical protein
MTTGHLNTRSPRHELPLLGLHSRHAARGLPVCGAPSPATPSAQSAKADFEPW